MIGVINTGDPTGKLSGLSSISLGSFSRLEYLKSVRHNIARCDRCITQIQGEWFRCAYCGRDLCDTCEKLDTHDNSHIFIVFKSTVSVVNPSSKRALKHTS
jgi:hypothetical protein